jgi:hypothetical protein
MATVLENHEGPAQPKIDRNRAKLTIQVGLWRNPDPSGRQRLPNVYIRQNHALTPLLL